MSATHQLRHPHQASSLALDRAKGMLYDTYLLYEHRGTLHSSCREHQVRQVLHLKAALCCTWLG